MSAAAKCYQCGRVDPMISEDDPEWLVCGYCGSRLMTAEEFRASIEAAEEERVKRALGFDQFKPSGQGYTNDTWSVGNGGKLRVRGRL